ncbi:MAG TPA: tetratricopeptide repeat protein [Acidiferrobacterales bacterium]|nr:tetratricopeptide repeat protein [Acidiferrobacterales bacterium]
MAAKSKPSSKYEAFDNEELIALARLDIERGEFEEALWKLKQVLVESTPPAEALSMAGRLYAQLGLRDRAKPLFQRYLELEPHAVNETFQLGMVHFDAGQPQEAKKIWGQLLKNHPAHPPGLFYQALVLTQEGQAAQAKQLLDSLLKSAPADNLYFGRAKELLQAIEARQPLSSLSPNNGKGVTKETPRITPKDAYKTEH